MVSITCFFPELRPFKWKSAYNLWHDFKYPFYDTFSLNPFQYQIAAILKCQYVESVEGGVVWWGKGESGRGGGERGVRSVFTFCFLA